jgi:hypothetical protein
MNRIAVSSLIALVALSAHAELKNVVVGGSIHIRGVYFGGVGEKNNNFIEQRSTINTKAEFSDNVDAFIELDSVGNWGTDFRSNYVTGTDTPSENGDVGLYQAYIDVKQIGGQPLNLRIGRQEIVLGSGWLIGNNLNKKVFTGLSFDALHLTYTPGDVAFGAVYAKGFENHPNEEDGDVDIYAAYAAYKGLENHNFLAYYLLGRDARSIEGSDGFFSLATLGIKPDFDPTTIHTVGLRANGKFGDLGIGTLDYDAEAAYQFGQADQVGSLFKSKGAEWGAWGATAETGYAFDAIWNPRVFLGAVYFGGEDNRDNTNKTSVSFNRLFSNVEYGIIDDSSLSNVWIARGGAQVSPIEKLTLAATLSHFQAVETNEKPWGKTASGDLGWETALVGSYKYTDDLTFRLGWEHLFTGDGLKEGDFVQQNGLASTAGVYKDQVDLVFADAELRF